MHRNWTDLIKPKGVEIDHETRTANYCRFVCEPLERGYGHTLGNALRRILLSSLQGAAVTAVRIDGALHEFMSLPDVKEDVTVIILNIKEILIKSDVTEPVWLHVEKHGPGYVYARDIEPSNNVEILNPDHIICTLGEDAHFVADLCVDTGKGYRRCDELRDPDLPIGTIVIDALFSPVQRVNYTVTNARVGQHTDYDKLTLEVWTDGSVAPEDAVAFAAKILKEQVSIFINFDEDIVPVETVEETVEVNSNEYLDRSVNELELSVRSANCLQNANIRFIGELVQKTEADMLKTKNFGRKSLREIKDILQRMGLTLGMSVDNWEPPV
ncbi:MAG: DNA-directed RNA polymerase subunit alpha [Proteobacteria bacterium]|nr:DNA-directed RNA polymerase subunit alpha [Pseudomonadota bacterium]MBQ4361110.1 DNA-directed RNA polymerase subunit alpha [Pseudomonadota bacterium]